MSEYMNPVTIFILSLAGAGIGAYVGSYLREKGKNLATHEDINRVVRATEEIRAQISGGLWLDQNRWTFKAGFYKDLLESVGILASALSQVLEADRLRSATQDAEQRHELDRLGKIHDEKATAAFDKLIRAEVVAQVWLGSEAIAAFDVFADEWGQAWVTSKTGVEIARKCQAAAVNLHALLSSIARTDLQLRRVS